MSKRRSMTMALAAMLLLVGGGSAVAVLATGDDGPRGAAPVSIETLQLAASNTETSDSVQFELRTTGLVDVRASGAVSGDGRTGSVQIDLGGFGRLEQRIVDGTVYVNAGNLLPGSDGKWLAIPLDRLGDLDSSPLLGALGGSPESALGMLEDAAGPVERVGDDTVAGRHATHYRASLTTGGATVPLDVWIDDADRVVKVHGSLPDRGAEVTLEVTAFGVPVDVVAPPADEVAPFPGTASGVPI